MCSVHADRLSQHAVCVLCSVDLSVLALRWTHHIKHSISLHVVVNVANEVATPKSVNTARPRRGSKVQTMMNLFSRPKMAPLFISYIDQQSVTRQLILNMPAEKADEWYAALQDLIASVPLPAADLPRRVWIQSVVRANSQRGVIGRVALRSLLNHANISLNNDAVKSALKAVDENALPAWLSSDDSVLNELQVAQILLPLSTASLEIDRLFDRFSDSPESSELETSRTLPGVPMAGWVDCVRTEQLSMKGEGKPEAGGTHEIVAEQLKAASIQFAEACSGAAEGARLSRHAFARMLLSPLNDACRQERPFAPCTPVPQSSAHPAHSCRSPLHTLHICSVVLCTPL